jgi:hypothetical protein
MNKQMLGVPGGSAPNPPGFIALWPKASGTCRAGDSRPPRPLHLPSASTKRGDVAYGTVKATDDGLFFCCSLASRCSLTIAILRACVKNLRFDIAVHPFEIPLNSSTRFCTLHQIRQNRSI